MRLGGELYNETEIGLSFGLRLMDVLLLGARGRWCHLSIARYGSASAIALDVSVALTPLPGLVLATLVEGVNRPAIGFEELLPCAIVIGASYAPNGRMELCLEWSQETRSDPGFAGGVEFAPVELLRLRAGVLLQTRSWTCGIGLRYEGFLCDYGLIVHPILGARHTISLGVHFD
jgi:hypothetical protein